MCIAGQDPSSNPLYRTMTQGFFPQDQPELLSPAGVAYAPNPGSAGTKVQNPIGVRARRAAAPGMTFSPFAPVQDATKQFS